MFVSAAKMFRGWGQSILASIIVMAAGQVEARMYQWSNGASGTVQLSGSPPAWYRSAAPGPRVFVFDNGTLIDDTAVTVTEEHRQVLRRNAFGGLDKPDLAEAKASQTSQAALLGALENANRDGIDVTAVGEAFAVEKHAAEDDGGMVDQTVAELKALLDAWDSRRLNEAKSVLQNATDTAE